MLAHGLSANDFTSSGGTPLAVAVPPPLAATDGLVPLPPVGVRAEERGVLAVGARAGNLHSREHYEAKFLDWMNEHGRSSSEWSGEEFVTRLDNFGACVPSLSKL